MQKVYVLLFGSMILVYAGYIDKRTFDLEAPGLAKAASFFEYETLSNSCLEATLISGGYFTLGTNSGTVESTLDDNCALMYGHPYAKTSYPLFSMDGHWFKLDEYFPDISSETLFKQGDSLVVRVQEKNLFQLEFCLLPEDAENKLKFSINITNLDSHSHDFGIGLVTDPGIGKWGDGYIYLDEVFISDDVIFTDWPEDLSLNIYEKSIGAKGINFSVDFDSIPPDKVIAANWADLYISSSPAEFSENPLGKIYDLTVKIIWNETEVAPLENTKRSAVLTLNEPDFTSQAFMRWDLASFLTMENNRLFPRDYKTSFEIFNLSDANLENIELNINIPLGFSLGDSESHISIPLGAPAYPQVNLHSNLVYEDYIVGLTARLEDDGVILDEIVRNVYIPATPVSDSGLIVTIDSIITSHFPKVQFIFNVKNEEYEYHISNIKKENVFLYENLSRIDNFKIMEDTTGGVSSADIIFVLDVTGSMSNEINEVKDNIIEFADSLDRRGVNYRLGMVTFLDEIENIYNFTDDVQEFQSIISAQYAHGGGDGPENSLDALMEASQFEFRSNAKRVIIWITDNSYHEADWATSLIKSEVIDELLSNEITTHCIGAEEYKSTYYDPILLATGGDYFDIYGNFRDILIKISRFNSSGKLMIEYESVNASAGTNQVQLDIRYQGLGGGNSFEYDVSGEEPVQEFSLNCYPNPFNPTVTFQINNPLFIDGTISIYNVLGQRVKTIVLSKDSPHKITWNAQNDQGKAVVSGLYIVQLSLKGRDGKKYHETARILHLK